MVPAATPSRILWYAMELCFFFDVETGRRIITKGVSLTLQWHIEHL
jgi:hypothetical protein